MKQTKVARGYTPYFVSRSPRDPVSGEERESESERENERRRDRRKRKNLRPR